MTIREIKESISAFQDKNSFDYERKDCEEVNRLFFPSPESFEIIRSEHKDRFYLMPASGRIPLLYRGQSREIIPCLPTLYRGNPSELKIFADRMRLVEFECLLESHPLVRHFKSLGMSVDAEGLAQHYGINTEILDFSSDIDIALFFAMCPYDSSTDEYRLPDESKGLKGIVYVVNPLFYDPQAFNGNTIDMFRGIVEPIGLQPFERPAVQKGYGIRLSNRKPLQHVAVFDLEYTMDQARGYYEKFAQNTKLWVKDELIAPTKNLLNKSTFHPWIFKEAWDRYPISGLTKSQCKKKLECECGIFLNRDAEIRDFSTIAISESMLEERWNSYIKRIVSRKVLDIDSSDNTVNERTPFMTTQLIAHMEMLRIVGSGRTYPEGVRPCEKVR